MDVSPDIARIMDANFNRAREALRVMEEYARLVCNDANLADLAKQLRHDMAVIVADHHLEPLVRAREIVGDEPFAVFLPDDVIIDRRPAIGQMIEVYDRYGSSVLAVRAVDRELTSAYGVIDADEIEPNVFDVKGLVEKPAPENAPSNLAIVGRYILTPEIFAALESIGPGSGGEIQLTDGIAALMNHQKVYAYAFSGSRYDTGTPLGLLKASIEIALRRPDIATDLREYLGSLDSDAFDSADLRIWLDD